MSKYPEITKMVEETFSKQAKKKRYHDREVKTRFFKRFARERRIKTIRLMDQLEWEADKIGIHINHPDTQRASGCDAHGHGDGIPMIEEIARGKREYSMSFLNKLFDEADILVIDVDKLCDGFESDCDDEGMMSESEGETIENPVDEGKRKWNETSKCPEIAKLVRETFASLAKRKCYDAKRLENCYDNRLKFKRRKNEIIQLMYSLEDDASKIGIYIDHPESRRLSGGSAYNPQIQLIEKIVQRKRTKEISWFDRLLEEANRLTINVNVPSGKSFKELYIDSEDEKTYDEESSESEDEREKRDRDECDDDEESEKENDENPTKKLKLEKNGEK